MHTAGEGEGGTNRGSSIETHTLSYAKCTASGNLLYDAGSSNLVLCDYLEGVRWVGVGERFRKEGTYVYLRLIPVDVWQKRTRYCKAIILQLKINKI